MEVDFLKPGDDPADRVLRFLEDRWDRRNFLILIILIPILGGLDEVRGSVGKKIEADIKQPGDETLRLELAAQPLVNQRLADLRIGESGAFAAPLGDFFRVDSNDDRDALDAEVRALLQ